MFEGGGERGTRGKERTKNETTKRGHPARDPTDVAAGGEYDEEEEGPRFTQYYAADKWLEIQYGPELFGDPGKDDEGKEGGAGR